MERRTFLGTCAALLGVPRFAEPVRPMRSKPYIEEGRPEYEEPHGYFCVQHGGSPACERMNVQNGLTCPRCNAGNTFIDMDNLTCRWVIDPDGYARLLGPRPDEEWAHLSLEKAVTRQ